MRLSTTSHAAAAVTVVTTPKRSLFLLLFHIFLEERCFSTEDANRLIVVRYGVGGVLLVFRKMLVREFMASGSCSSGGGGLHPLRDKVESFVFGLVDSRELFTLEIVVRE